MRSRSALVLPVLALAVALIGPAQANADSFPSKAGDFVSDNIQYFVAGLVAAILLLLLVVSVTQRRSKASTNKKKNEGGAVATPTAPIPPAAATASAQPPRAPTTAELPVDVASGSTAGRGRRHRRRPAASR